jgi:hypothetical protein
MHGPASGRAQEGRRSPDEISEVNGFGIRQLRLAVDLLEDRLLDVKIARLWVWRAEDLRELVFKG